LSSTSNHRKSTLVGYSYSAAFALLLICHAISSTAQSALDTDPAIDLDTQITAAKSYLMRLDESARLCLVDSSDSEACKEFRESISTAQLSIYQALCEPLVIWREQLVSNNAASHDENGAQLTLTRLLDVEFACGNKALINRTQYVAQAYAAIQNGSRQPGLGIASNGLNQTERDSYNLRQSVINSVDQSQNRLQRETDLQWRRLEIENAVRLQQRLKVNLSNPSLQ